MKENEVDEKKPCHECGRDDDTVKWLQHPYLEYYGIEDWDWMCKKCEYQALMDI